MERIISVDGQREQNERARGLGLRPEDQAGLRIPNNFSTPLLQKSEVSLRRPNSQKTKARLARRAWADKANGEGENSYLEFAVTH